MVAPMLPWWKYKRVNGMIIYMLHAINANILCFTSVHVFNDTISCIDAQNRIASEIARVGSPGAKQILIVRQQRRT